MASVSVPSSSWALLAVGVGAASTAAILVRYASDAEPLALSFWRCAGAAVGLAPFAIRRLVAMGAPTRLPAFSGLFLAFHFATWITSLRLTTVAASSLLVTTTPIFVALAAWLLWRERLPSRAWAGIGATVVGVALVGGGGLGGSSLLGNSLALAGGAAAAGYAMTGRSARLVMGTLEYAVIAYAAAAAALLVACLATDAALWGYDAATWAAVAGLVAGPQLLGHTLINFALRDIDVVSVSISIMAEPVIATVLALLLLKEAPPPLVVPGGLLLLAGIYVVLTSQAAERT
ncbi:MAG: DMT family transporter [Actinomycetota bacterium]|nr:DMT family transporter [Actinomycetota bacterium]